MRTVACWHLTNEASCWPEQVCALLEGWAAQYPEYTDVESIGQTYETLPSHTLEYVFLYAG